jgi:hypothetical protein
VGSTIVQLPPMQRAGGSQSMPVFGLHDEPSCAKGTHVP